MKRGTHIVLSGLFFVVETAAAFGVVFGAAYGLTRLAEYRANAPVTAGGDGVAILSPAKATLRGGLTLYPTDLENRTDNYCNEYGRELAKERRNRKIGNWTSVDDAAQWQFSVNPGGEYRVEIELAAPAEAAGSEIEVKIGPKSLAGTVPDTGGFDIWKRIALGRVKLEAGTHTLVLAATAIEGEKVMNVANVVLRPAE